MEAILCTLCSFVGTLVYLWTIFLIMKQVFNFLLFVDLISVIFNSETIAY